MKIYVGGKIFPDSFADNIAFTLRNMGHEVFHEQPKSLKASFSLIGRVYTVARNTLQTTGMTAEEKNILYLIRRCKPDLFLCSTSHYSQEFFCELGKIAPKRVMWWGDPLANSYRLGITPGQWDFVYVKDRDQVAKLKLIGVNAFYLPEAMNPAWHRLVSEQTNSHLVVMGNYYGFRQIIAGRLIRDGVLVELHGSQPPRWALPEIRSGWSRRYLTKEQKSMVLGAGAACLNTFSYAEGNSLNCRAFEIAGAGGLQLIEYRPAIEEHFEIGRELLAFKTYEELKSQVERAIRFPAEMRPIRQSGLRRAVADHTYEIRLNYILGQLGK